MIMKPTKLLFILVSLSGPLSVFAQADRSTYTTIGSISCGKWVSTRQEGLDSWPSRAYTGWALGYLSGLNSLADKRKPDPLKGTDPESVQLWIDNYCRSSPLSSLAIASEALWLELVVKRTAR
jgi:hypothetical protein